MIDTSDFFNEEEKEYILSDKNKDSSIEIMIVLLTISIVFNIFFAIITFV